VKGLYAEERKAGPILGALAMTIYPFVALVLFSERSVFVAVFFVLLEVFVFMHGRKGRKTTIIRAVVSVGIMALAVVILVASSVYLYHTVVTAPDFDPWDDSHFYSYHLNRIFFAAKTVMDSDAYFRSPVLNLLNAFSSARLEIAAKSLQQIGWVGHSYQEVFALNYTATTPHNLFLLALINFGIVGGAGFIIWFVLSMVKSIKDSARGHVESVFAALWFFFCFFVLLFTASKFASPIFFGLLFLQYPLVRKWEE
jgi:hypothetical protein